MDRWLEQLKGTRAMAAPRRSSCLAQATAIARGTLTAMTVLVATGALAQMPSPRAPLERQAPPGATSESARQILSRVRSSVVQIKGFFGSNTAQAFHGTGFAVARGGIFLTNYHVVAQQVLYPTKYRLEYRTHDGETGPIEVLAIDVRHDLAVVRAQGIAPRPLPLETTVPDKGDRAFAVGFPLDVGLTITEGVSNGRVEDSFDPRIHYSGALNAGMSGGPALNTAAAVIGVNVAGYRFEQLVSFLVPSIHVRALLGRALKPASGGLKGEVAAQMREHAVELIGALDGPFTTQVMSGYALPAKLAHFVDCSASSDPAPERPLQLVRVRCLAKAGLFVEQGLYSGDLRFEHYVLETSKLDAWRFAQRLSKLSVATGGFGQRRYVGPFSCTTGVVKLKGFDASLMTCVRGHRKLGGLYDITARVTSLNESQRGFVSHVDMHGVEFDAGMTFLQRYVEAMEWNP
jgi:S1-C subfamily serine protease